MGQRGRACEKELSARVSRRRWITSIALAACMALAAGVATVVAPDWKPTRRDIATPAPAEHPRLATQTQVRHAVRSAHLRWAGMVLHDTAAEACERYSTQTWSEKLGV